jgi:hypothetical protein
MPPYRATLPMMMLSAGLKVDSLGGYTASTPPDRPYACSNTTATVGSKSVETQNKVCLLRLKLVVTQPAPYQTDPAHAATPHIEPGVDTAESLLQLGVGALRAALYQTDAATGTCGSDGLMD